MRFFFFLMLLTLGLVACTANAPLNLPVPSTPIHIEAIPTVDPSNARLAKAQRDYNTFCAHCHGYGGEGQPEASIGITEGWGYHTVPLHNAAGHTWQHPSQVFFETVKYGIQNPTSLYVMPPHNDVLTDDEIFALIDYISMWWTAEQRAWQAQVTSQFTENNHFWEIENLDSYQEAESTPEQE